MVWISGAVKGGGEIGKLVLDTTSSAIKKEKIHVSIALKSEAFASIARSGSVQPGANQGWPPKIGVASAGQGDWRGTRLRHQESAVKYSQL